MRRAALIALATLAAAVIGARPAHADPIGVQVLFEAFSPSQIDAVPGDAITWSNISERTHTVTAQGGAFDSGELASGGSFAITAGAEGTYAYHCTIHPSMTGEIDVRDVILGALPPVAVPAGERVQVKGRTSDPQSPVTIERDVGSGFHAIGTAMPAPDGSWSSEITAETTGDYRAVAGLHESQTRRLLVIDRRVELRQTKRGVSVGVVPSLPYGHLLLERNTRERFGWFPVARERLDYVSRASFRIRRPATVRVLLVDKDGWTPLATSAAVHLRGLRRR
jgi:plastocyanin